jgi:hypothetical protein
MRGKRLCLAILSPLILTADLVLLLGSEIVCDIEGLANFLRRLSLDHVGDCLAANVEERLDVEIIGGLNVRLEYFLGIEQTTVTKIISKSIS